MEIKLVAPIGKIPRVDEELKEKVNAIPKDAPFEELIEVLRTHEREKKFYSFYLSKHEDLYRLTV